MLTKLGQFLIYLVACVVYLRCKKEEESKKNSIESNKPASTPESPTTQEKSVVLENSPGNQEPQTPLTNCLKGKYLNLANLKSAGEEFSLKYQLFGNPKQALLGFDFPKYRHRQKIINAFKLTDANGLVLAERFFSSFVDLKSNGRLTPIIIENLNLVQVDDLKIVIEFSSLEMEIVPTDKPITFTNTFLNRKVLHRNQNPAHIFVDHFIPSHDGFNTFSNNPIFYPFDKNQIQSTKSLKNLIVTDMAGNIISDQGQEFTSIVQDPMIVVYNPSQKGVFTRTLLRIP